MSAHLVSCLVFRQFFHFLIALNNFGRATLPEIVWVCVGERDSKNGIFCYFVDRCLLRNNFSAISETNKISLSRLETAEDGSKINSKCPDNRMGYIKLEVKKTTS